MPFFHRRRPILPWESSLHREAAIALFRALLTATRELPGTSTHQRHELQNIVRNRFKQNRHEQSNRRLRLNFSAGYEGLDVLDAARAGDTAQQAHIQSLLETASPHAKATPPTVLPRHLAREEKRKRPISEGDPSSSSSLPTRSKLNVLDRPLPLHALSGKRHVPRLFSAGGIPTLRLTKPFSPELSHIINKRLKTKQRRWDRIHELDDAMEVARLEDEWDQRMEEQLGSDDAGSQRQEPKWHHAPHGARAAIYDVLHAPKAKNEEWTRKLQHVVDQESELFLKERDERKQRRRTERESGGDTK